MDRGYYEIKKERNFYYDALIAFTIIFHLICHQDHFFEPLTMPQIIA